MITFVEVATVFAFAGGYVASVYTWPWLRTVSLGAEAEYDRLKARLADIQSKMRGL